MGLHAYAGLPGEFERAYLWSVPCTCMEPQPWLLMPKHGYGYPLHGIILSMHSMLLTDKDWQSYANAYEVVLPAINRVTVNAFAVVHACTSMLRGRGWNRTRPAHDRRSRVSATCTGR